MAYHEKLMELDQRICSGFQVPATVFEQLTDNAQLAEELALRRCAIAGAAYADVLGTLLSVYGLADETHRTAALTAGLTLKVLAQVTTAHNSNKAGSMWRGALDEKLVSLSHLNSAVRSVLVDAGVSSDEVSALDGLGTEAYQAELHHASMQDTRNILASVGVSGSLLAFGEPVAATVTAALGAAGKPYGNYVYDQYQMRDSRLRAGRFARVRTYVKRNQNQHVEMTDRNNALTRSPEWFTMGMFASGAGREFLPIFYGVREGSTAVRGTMSHQRSSANAQQTVEKITHFVNALSRKPLIGNHTRWLEHVAEAGITQIEHPSFENGIIVNNLSPVLPSGQYQAEILPVSFELPSGGAVVIKAKSGTGKSAMLLSLMHFLEHSGTVHVVKNGKAIDVHQYSNQDQLTNDIAYISEDGLSGNARLVDIFSHLFLQSHREYFEAYAGQYDPELVEVAWLMPDNQLDKEISRIEKGKGHIFTLEMLHMLKNIVSNRRRWVKKLLFDEGGNLATNRIHGKRTFGSLSAGEKRRLITAIAKTTAYTRNPKVIILDEPLTHLDEENRQLQKRSLQDIQSANSGLLIISHEYVDELEQELEQCQVVKLERNGNGGVEDTELPESESWGFTPGNQSN